MKADKVEVHYPECSAVYLADYLWEVGPTHSAGVGEAPISHADIAAWQHNTGIQLTSWEARTLRGLSTAYLVESQQATKPACPSPLIPELTDEIRVDVAKRVRNLLRG